MKNSFAPFRSALPRRQFLQLTALGAFAVAATNPKRALADALIGDSKNLGVAPNKLLAAEKSYLVAPRVAPKVQPFSLAQVRLLPGPFLHAQNQDHAYLLFLEPDRFLHNFHKFARFEPKAEIYGGWESQGVAGQTLGHYLSALSQMYQTTGDARLKAKLDYTVGQLAMIQDKYGDGYVSGIPDGRAMFAVIKAGDPNGAKRGWVPWYTMHKLFAGLRDAYLLTGNEQAKTVLIKLSDWAIDTTKSLSDAQWETMLEQEHGGMNETLADVYALTGQRKYLDLAHHFSHKLILNPLTQREDKLDGFHANTQIPKIIGFERIYALDNESDYGTAAKFFWQTVTQNRTYVTGGNSDREHFFPPADTGAHLSAETAETCNIYNMLKLTRDLWKVEPTGAQMDWYERALYNQILGSQDPIGGDKGGFNYLNPLSTGQFKVYSNPTTAFWCCVGTGIENHAKYGDTIYYHDADSLWVNLFIPSQLTWADKGLVLTQQTRFPDADTSNFALKLARPTQMALKIRQPSWAQNMTIAVNGKAQPTAATGNGYETISRQWRDGDIVEVRLPMSLRTEQLHATPQKQAILYGPIVLAANLGPNGLETDYVDSQTQYSGAALPAAPVFVTTGAATEKVTRANSDNLAFSAQMLDSGDGSARAVPMLPYSRAHHMRYGVYFDVLTPTGWQTKRAEIAAEAARERDIAARTVDIYRPGEQQNEVEHAFNGRNSNSGNAGDFKWRDARDGGFIEFALQAPPAGVGGELSIKYWGNDNGDRDFDILVDGQKVGSQVLNNDKPNEYFDAIYQIPPQLLAGKTRVTVRVAAKPGKTAGGVFGARMLKK